MTLMFFVNSALLGVGLAMDAAAVSMCKGLAVCQVKPKHCFIAGAYFGIFQGLMPLLEFEDGKLVSVKIRPVELNFLADKACKGLPQLADPEVTEDIYKTLCRLSAPYGTDLQLKDGLITVHVP